MSFILSLPLRRSAVPIWLSGSAKNLCRACFDRKVLQVQPHTPQLKIPREREVPQGPSYCSGSASKDLSAWGMHNSPCNSMAAYGLKVALCKCTSCSGAHLAADVCRVGFLYPILLQSGRLPNSSCLRRPGPLSALGRSRHHCWSSAPQAPSTLPPLMLTRAETVNNKPSAASFRRSKFSDLLYVAAHERCCCVWTSDLIQTCMVRSLLGSGWSS